MHSRLLFAALCAALLAGSAGADPRDGRRGARSDSEPPDRFTTSDGRTWERNRLRYLDVRQLAAVLGAPVLPNEVEIMAMRMGGYGGGYGSFGGGYGGYGGYGGGYGGFGAGSPAFAPGGGYGYPAYGYGGGAPGSFYQPSSGSGVGFLPRGGQGPAIFGDRNSNSLIVGPGGRGAGGVGGRGAQGSGLFPGLVIIGDRNSNSLLVDP